MMELDQHLQEKTARFEKEKRTLSEENKRLRQDLEKVGLTCEWEGGGGDSEPPYLEYSLCQTLCSCVCVLQLCVHVYVYIYMYSHSLCHTVVP